MRTLFVCNERNINRHVGENYDVIIEVEHQPTTETFQKQADQVMNAIRSLWHEQVKAGEYDPKVSVNLDAASPFNLMLMNLQIIMGKEENIVVELPYLPPQMREDRTDDTEAAELLKKLEGSRNQA